MDTTGSMGSYIKSATEHVRSIVDKIVISEKCDVRLALVEYRDHPPQVHKKLNKKLTCCDYSIDKNGVFSHNKR